MTKCTCPNSYLFPHRREKCAFFNPKSTSSTGQDVDIASIATNIDIVTKTCPPLPPTSSETVVIRREPVTYTDSESTKATDKSSVLQSTARYLLHDVPLIFSKFLIPNDDPEADDELCRRSVSKKGNGSSSQALEACDVVDKTLQGSETLPRLDFVTLQNEPCNCAFSAMSKHRKVRCQWRGWVNQTGQVATGISHWMQGTTTEKSDEEDDEHTEETDTGLHFSDSEDDNDDVGGEGKKEEVVGVRTKLNEGKAQQASHGNNKKTATATKATPKTSHNTDGFDEYTSRVEDAVRSDLSL